MKKLLLFTLLSLPLLAFIFCSKDDGYGDGYGDGSFRFSWNKSYVKNINDNSIVITILNKDGSTTDKTYNRGLTTYF